MDRFGDIVQSVSTWLITAVVGGIGWLIRRVITNQKQIEMLQDELRRREKLRDEDRERMAKIERGVERIEGWMLERRK